MFVCVELRVYVVILHLEEHMKKRWDFYTEVKNSRGVN